MKTAQNYLDEANAAVPKISVEEGMAKHQSGGTVFVDVRDSGDIAASGTIAGALRVPRGMLEFRADSNTPFHDAELQKDRTIVLHCASGGRAALAGKLLKDMGFQSVFNMGGLSDWKAAGGELIEPVDPGM